MQATVHFARQFPYRASGPHIGADRFTTVASSPLEHPYSRHDPQNYGTVSNDRNGSSDGSSGLDVRRRCSECLARSGATGNTFRILHLRVWMLHRGRVLLRIPQGAVVIWAGAIDRLHPVLRLR